ncbi:MAG TPA: ElyC/SanA/YdcF family protein [Syntrophales bacterium]|jgi:uncharacterized SAM-binding protein YcdF (DUF218 family)|nr:ElyC/SanA/YdcF family protein [Syntrophales bacterium]HON24269.1 ElyC/SanA/YdcF family protein [Syntrophales bacterium]HOU76518.1 ElyC/SanA/YdcF family protein [Syntrophales bacterium]HQG33852.1 ElyC/SanA/YdcF family protein [Syntrophales bacterium]HQI35150.1 ElyC/SanA/YdcF family protein [Syntrophales bacterium]
MDILFLMKKTVTPFFMPLSIILVLLLSGLFILGKNKKKPPAGKFLILTGTVLLALASYGFIVDPLITPLESRYPPLLNPEDIPRRQDVKFVVVLGGGSYPAGDLPLSSRLSPESLTRLLEGMRLYRLLPGTKLLLSGGAFLQDEPEAALLAKTALLMGAREEDLLREDKSLDTADQAREIAAMIGKSHFLLVTSAVHMPRSVTLFRRHGLDPVPAPTNFLAVKRTRLQPGSFFPNATSLRKLEATGHEYLGLLAIMLRK